MGRVVQKYGGSSVADAESIKRVAKRIVATKQDGNEVVVVISAMGDTTDELMDLALQVSPLPPPRELDMLPIPDYRAFFAQWRGGEWAGHGAPRYGAAKPAGWLARWQGECYAISWR